MDSEQIKMGWRSEMKVMMVGWSGISQIGASPRTQEHGQEALIGSLHRDLKGKGEESLSPLFSIKFFTTISRGKDEVDKKMREVKVKSTQEFLRDRSLICFGGGYVVRSQKKKRNGRVIP